jgi:hypothetical protein
MGHVLCADCGKVVAIYFDGHLVRLAVHDVCGMGGKPLEVNERARRLAEALKRKSEAWS